MLDASHLKLKLVRLKPTEQWVNQTDGISLIFAQAGIGSFAAGGVNHRLDAGDVLALNGVGSGKISADAKSDFLFRGFSLGVDQFFPLFESREISFLNSVVDRFKAGKFYPRNSALAQNCQKLIGAVEAQFNLEHRSQLLRIAAAVLTVEFQSVQGQLGNLGRTGDHTLRAFEKLSSAELLNLSVDELAKKFNCSRRHLNRLFHDHFGVSVSALRMEMRLLKAVSLLRDPDLKVINVAEQCGFNHLGLFNTCFKRRFGTSPGKWQKAQMKLGSPPSGKTAGAHSCPLQSKGICPWTGWSEKTPGGAGAKAGPNAATPGMRASIC